MLAEAGFAVMERQPGLWRKAEMVDGSEQQIELDLLIGKTLIDNVGRRSARKPPHDAMSFRWVEGIELACVDRSPMTIVALEPDDRRQVVVDVAGPTALLVAKAFKINDRVRGADRFPDRLTNKDAGDVLRLMMTTPPAVVTAAFDQLRADERVGAVTRTGERLLRELFGGRAALGVGMAVEALRGDVPEGRVRALAPAFVAALD
jgi:hypothetical protein